MSAEPLTHAVPPQNLEAEESVLGAMLISPNAIDAVRDIVNDGDFYRESSAVIYRRALALHDSGEPVDAITLGAALEEAGEIEQAGGRVRLHELARLVPATANVRHYATIVRDASVLRSMIRIGGEIAQLGWEREGEPLDLIGQAEELVAGLRARRDIEQDEVVTLHDAAVYLDAKFRNPPDESDWIPGPWSFVPRMGPGRMYVLGGYAKDGKGLALDTPLPTPHGWTTMGDVRVGTELLGADGLRTTVTFVSEIHHLRCFEVEFSDGSVIVCDEQHRWLTADAQERASLGRRRRRVYRGGPYAVPQKTRDPQVRAIIEIADTLRVHGKANHSVKCTEPLDLPRIPPHHLPVAPYTLGAWLGDGDSASGRITSADPQVAREIESEFFRVIKQPQRDRTTAYRVEGFTAQLKSAGVLGNKHVPPAYLRASMTQRLALLQGLMDTDGYVSKRGQCEFTSTSLALAEGVYELLCSFGVVATLREGTATLNGRVTGPKYRVMFTTDLPVFRLRRKLDRICSRDVPRDRKIVAVREVESVPTRCITVDSSDHLFLAGRAMIPTHNTAAACQFFHRAARDGHSTTFLTLEMSKWDLTERLAAVMGIPARTVQTGQLGDDQQLARNVLGEMTLLAPHARVWDAPAVDIPTIRSHVKGVRPKLLIVDHLHQFHLRSEYERQDLENVVRGLWRIAREFSITVLLLAQLSRAGDKKNPYPMPTMSAVKGSGAIEQLAWAVWFVYRQRDDANLPTDESLFVVAANRSGITGTRRLQFHPRHVRYGEIAREA